MRALAWTLRALIFLALFAFALNNQQEAVVHWFFGHEWRAPMVIVVLAPLPAGCVFGVRRDGAGWWRHRRVARAAHAPMRRSRRRRRPHRRSSAPTMPPANTRPAMDFDIQWLLLGLPVAFALGWLGSRFDLRQWRREQKDSSPRPTSRA
jgi:putative membrane protein